MLQRISKYQILDQIGRGGMGTVYRAHDPVLERTVALKVISRDVEVTDELRTRFFREAQACAKLSHPNVITVHDLGEEDGYLFIVMEYLEGDELKQIIAQRRRLSLEDKLAVMTQVCAGMDYAHQKGVIHRDIKPGNVFVLRNGTAKILDFGIARIASAATGLTRTGLIMGTLRYMSPEQARGRADARSDIFSAGTVFYELLAYRPCFAGEDPMEILEQLRSEDPVPLVQVDPTIPPALGAAIERALRKDPEQRFQSFAEMRAELELVRRQLEEHSGQLRARLRGRVEEIGRLRQTLAERVGTAPGPGSEAEVVPGDVLSFTAAETLYHELSSTANRLAELIERADALESDYQRAVQRLQQGDPEGAAAQLGALLAAMPEHARAAEALRRAQSVAEERREARVRLESLLREVEAAFEQGAYARCLERLEGFQRPAVATGVEERIEGLREAAAAALAAEEAARQEALRQAIERAQQTEVLASEARTQAQAAGAAELAGPLWSVAEARLADAETGLARQAYGPASKRLEEAADLYRRAADAARREAVRRARERAHRAQMDAEQASRRAQEAGAPGLAGEAWIGAEQRRATGEADLLAERHEAAARAFEEASHLYLGAMETARRESIRLAREQAVEARAGADEARRQAQDAAAPSLAREPWQAAEAGRGEAESHLAAERWREAAQGLARAGQLYRRAGDAARQEADRRAREGAQRAQAQAAEMRRLAQQAQAGVEAIQTWAAAERARGEGEALLAAGRQDGAARAFAEAARLYRSATEEARRGVLARAEAEAGEARVQALEAGAPDLAASLWQAAERQWSTGRAPLDRPDAAAGVRLLDMARDLYRQAAERARHEAGRRIAVRLEEARHEAEAQRDLAEQRDAAGLAADLWREAETLLAGGRADEGGGRLDAAIRQFGEARDRYRRGSEAARQEAERRARGQAEEARGRASAARAEAREADAPGLAPDAWAAAEGKLAGGEAALSRQMPAQAARQFGEAVDLYGRAAADARHELRATAREAGAAALERAEIARERARGLGAEALAPEEWAAAQERLAAGQAALAGEVGRRAAALLDEATDLYDAAGETARRESRIETRHELGRRQQEAEQARERAARSDATVLAPGPWAAAEGRLAEGRAAADRDAAAEGVEHFGEALRLYDQAEAVARQAPQVPASAAPAALEERAAASRARLEAEAARAPSRATGPWAAAVAATDQARESLERGDIPAARELFARARAGFEEAARASREAAGADRFAAARAQVAAGELSRAMATLEALLVEQPASSEVRQLLEEVRARQETAPAATPGTTGGEGAGEGDVTLLDDSTRVLGPGSPRKREGPGGDATVARPPHRPRAPAAQSLRAVVATWRSLAVAAGLLVAVGGAALWYASSARQAGPPSPVAPGPQELRATDLQERSTAARALAREGNAETLAPDLFREAAASEASADRALGEREFARAAEQYGQALRGYEAALAEAGLAAARAASDQAVDRARRLMAEARRAAESAGAPRHAPAKWTEATALEQRAEQALQGRDAGGAQAAFAQAEQAYVGAGLSARQGVDEERRRQRETEVARVRTLSAEARRLAEGANAPREAGPKWAEAIALEKGAERALERKDLDVAQAGFGQAERAFREALALADQRAAEQRRGQQEAEAGRAQTLAIEARRAAESADAPRQATAKWTEATALEQKAEQALERKDLDAAQAGFGDAERAFREATALAAEHGRKQQEAEAGRTRTLAAEARRAAESADAPRHAAARWTEAAALEQKAEQALKRNDLGGARAAFGEAERTYREALALARQSAEDERRKQDEARREQEGRRARAAQAREATAQARQGAEQAAADRHAARPLAAARGKEREGEAAFQRQEYDRARELFQGAEADYREAARQAGQMLAALGRDVDRLRARASTEHDQAVRAEGDVLARGAFERAQARRAEADGLLARQDLGGAKQAYTDAIQGYAEAVNRARAAQDARTRADEARGRMTSEKARASTASADYAAASAEERQGESQYQRLAFDEAARRFRVAADRYARATAPPPSPPRPPVVADPRTEAQRALDDIPGVLAAYVRALEGRDMALLRQVMPGLSDADIQRIRDSFAQAASIKVDLTTDATEARGSIAHVRGQRRDTLVDKDGKMSRHEGRFSMTLVRTSAGWHIEQLRND